MALANFPAVQTEITLWPEVLTHLKHKHKLDVVVIRLGTTMSVIVVQSDISSKPLKKRG